MVSPIQSVYIASPYALGDTALNVKRQHIAFKMLDELGIFPYMPLMSHYQHMHSSKTGDDWITFDLHWLDKCDAVLRLSGESRGADIEVQRARETLKPIMFDAEDMRTTLELIDVQMRYVYGTYRNVFMPEYWR